MERLSDIGEDSLIERLICEIPDSPGVIAGPGDDCAVLASHSDRFFELLKTDCIVEGVHFEAGEEPDRVGWKALCRALSDIAAMAGTPRAALVTIAVPVDRVVGEIEGWYRGIRKAASEYEVALVGGETSSLPPGDSAAVLSVTLTGWVEKTRCVFRSGAEIGDRIVVTGTLGGSLAGGRHLDFRPRLEEARWLAENTIGLTAMMDISDGLARDLPRLARASGTGYRLDLESLPKGWECDARRALCDGEDYELLAALEPSGVDRTVAEWQSAFPGVPLTVIGEITESVETPLEGGWDHFSMET